jgi:hypothetical protein
MVLTPARSATWAMEILFFLTRVPPLHYKSNVRVFQDVTFIPKHASILYIKTN